MTFLDTVPAGARAATLAATGQPFDFLPWIIGGAVLLLGGTVALLGRSRSAAGRETDGRDDDGDARE